MVSPIRQIRIIRGCVTISEVAVPMLSLLLLCWVGVLLPGAGSVILEALHLSSLPRYFHNPFLAKEHGRAFACFRKDPSVSDRIINHTHRDIVNMRRVLPQLFNQTILFFGDSLMQNQFISFASLVSEADPKAWDKSSKMVYSIYAPTYSLEVIFSFSETCLDIQPHQLGLLRTKPLSERKLQSILVALMAGTLGTRKTYRVPTVILASTGHHWMTDRYLSNGSETVDPLLFKAGLELITDLMSTMLKGTSTQVFFRAVPTRHFENGSWNTAGHCRRTEPIPNNELTDSPNVKWSVELSTIIKDAATQAGFGFVDILPVTIHRADAMVSELNTRGRLGNITDCVHYCVPGVPDLWNTLFLDSLLHNKTTKNAAISSTLGKRPRSREPKSTASLSERDNPENEDLVSEIEKIFSPFEEHELAEDAKEVYLWGLTAIDNQKLDKAALKSRFSYMPPGAMQSVCEYLASKGLLQTHNEGKRTEYFTIVEEKKPIVPEKPATSPVKTLKLMSPKKSPKKSKYPTKEEGRKIYPNNKYMFPADLRKLSNLKEVDILGPYGKHYPAVYHNDNGEYLTLSEGAPTVDVRGGLSRYCICRRGTYTANSPEKITATAVNLDICNDVTPALSAVENSVPKKPKIRKLKHTVEAPAATPSTAPKAKRSDKASTLQLSTEFLSKFEESKDKLLNINKEIDDRLSGVIGDVNKALEEQVKLINEFNELLDQQIEFKDVKFAANPVPVTKLINDVKSMGEKFVFGLQDHLLQADIFSIEVQRKILRFKQAVANHSD